MIHKAKDLSPDQKAAIEGLLGREVGDNEQISIRTVAQPHAPDWLEDSWQSAERQGVDQLSMEDIDAEIASARKEARKRPSRDR
jgi:hypothetical protein